MLVNRHDERLCRSTIGNRQFHQPQAGIFHPLGADSRQPTVCGQLRSAVISLPIARCLLLSGLLPSALSAPRMLASELCPADFVAWRGSASRGWEICARTWLHSRVTTDYYIILYYESQDESASVRGYKMSQPESKCSADLFCRSPAFSCQQGRAATLQNRSRYACSQSQCIAQCLIDSFHSRYPPDGPSDKLQFYRPQVVGHDYRIGFQAGLGSERVLHQNRDTTGMSGAGQIASPTFAVAGAFGG